MPASLQDSILQPSHTKAVIQAALRSPRGSLRTWCVVEADDDVEVFEKFFISDTVSVLPSTNEEGRRSCHNVELIVTELYQDEDNPNVFGIRDRDYTSFSDNYICPPNVFLTDGRDVEMMMLKSPSVIEFLYKKDASFAENVLRSETIMRFLGYLRIFNDIEQTSCIFKNNLTKISLVWDGTNHSVYPDYRDRLLTRFMKTCDREVSREEIHSFIENKELEQKSLFDVCQGHDVCRLLCAMMVKNEFSQPKVLFQWMKDAYTFTDFMQTSLYQDILNWANSRHLIVFPQRI